MTMNSAQHGFRKDKTF